MTIFIYIWHFFYFYNQHLILDICEVYHYSYNFLPLFRRSKESLQWSSLKRGNSMKFAFLREMEMREKCKLTKKVLWGFSSKFIKSMKKLVDSKKLIFSYKKFFFWESIWQEIILTYLIFIFVVKLYLIFPGLFKHL